MLSSTDGRLGHDQAPKSDDTEQDCDVTSSVAIRDIVYLTGTYYARRHE
jgi:hypothetical protein